MKADFNILGTPCKGTGSHRGIQTPAYDVLGQVSECEMGKADEERPGKGSDGPCYFTSMGLNQRPPLLVNMAVRLILKRADSSRPMPKVFSITS